MLHATPQERLALGVTALLLAAGAGARVVALGDPGARWEAAAGAAPRLQGSADLARLRTRADSQAARDRERSRPLGPGERIDPNRAGADQLERLPRVGPALAARLVAWREAHGPFRTLADLDSVPGVGPALLQALAPHLALASGAAGGGAIAAGGEGVSAVVNINAATAEQLESLPGVGPALARRIVQWRAAHGPFRSARQLEEVPGIGPALRARLEPRIRL